MVYIQNPVLIAQVEIFGVINNKIGIIITARVKSSRIHEKVLQQIGHQKAIEILIDKLNNNKYDVILAIPQNKDDDILEKIGREKGIQVYRGQDDSPLHRLYECALQFDFTHIVRITADDILIDTTLLFNQIEKHINGGHDYTFMRRCPEGIAGEVIKTSALETIITELGNEPVEFVSYYLKTNGFRVFEYFPPREYQFSYRLTMDWPEDLLLLRIIYASLKEPFGTLDIINFIKQHKYFLNINKLPLVTVYSCNYNTADYIIRCIDSVFKQTFDDFEYIILDDYSTDNSMNLIVEYISKLPLESQRKVRILRNNENKGLPNNCNNIISNGRGRYVVRVDSDDMVNETFLSRAIEELRLSEAQGCITGFIRIDEQDNKLKEILTNEWHPGCAVLSKWAVNELKYQENLEFMEGHEFFSRFRKKYKMAFIPEALWQYRQRTGQKTQNPNHPLNQEVK